MHTKNETYLSYKLQTKCKAIQALLHVISKLAKAYQILLLLLLLSRESTCYVGIKNTQRSHYRIHGFLCVHRLANSLMFPI